MRKISLIVAITLIACGAIWFGAGDSLNAQPPQDDRMVADINALKSEIDSGRRTTEGNFIERAGVADKWIRQIIFSRGPQQLMKDIPPGTLQDIRRTYESGDKSQAVLRLDQMLGELSKISDAPATGGMRPPLMQQNMQNTQAPPIGQQRELPTAPKVTGSSFRKDVMDRSLDSPFGFLDATQFKDDLFSWNDGYGGLLNELGVHWVISGATFGFGWSFVQGRNPDGSLSAFDWSRHDGLVASLQNNNINLIGIIGAYEPKEGPRARVAPALPKDMAAYRKFVAGVVERYDGDGRADAPGLLYPVKYWLVEDETFSSNYWGGTPEDYAILFNEAAATIKKADPAAKVILSTVYAARTDFPERFFRKLAEISRGRTPYDIMDQHWFVDPGQKPESQYSAIAVKMAQVESIANKYGFERRPFWSTETSGPYSPEETQARDLLKRYLFAIASGVKKVLWTSLEANRREPGGREDPFAGSALVEGGRKKPAFQAYKLMTSKFNKGRLLGAENISPDETAFIGRYTFDTQVLLAAWTDGSDRNITIPMPQKTSRARITDGLTSGVSTIDVYGGRLILKASANPVFIEPVVDGKTR